MDNQEIKADANKPKISLVPLQILTDVARVREFALKKYKSANSWKNVEIERYRDAMLRHMIAYIENPKGVDSESGLPHLSHLACNVAFLCEMEKEKTIEKTKEKTEEKTEEEIKSCYDCIYCVRDKDNSHIHRCSISQTNFIVDDLDCCDDWKEKENAQHT